MVEDSNKSRQAYVQALLESQALPAMIYAKRFTDGKGGFDELEVLATAQA